MVVDPTDSIDTGGVISNSSASQYAAVNKNINDKTVIAYLESYFEYFECHDTSVIVDPFDKFTDAHGSTFFQYRSFSSLQLLMWIPLSYMLPTGLPFIVVNRTLDPLQPIRLMRILSCAKMFDD